MRIISINLNGIRSAAKKGFYDWLQTQNADVICMQEIKAQEADQYTWWSNRGQAWAKNVGWRIDYQVVTPGLKDAIQTVSIYKDQRFSDHAPLIIDYHLP